MLLFEETFLIYNKMRYNVDSGGFNHQSLIRGCAGHSGKQDKTRLWRGVAAAEFQGEEKC